MPRVLASLSILLLLFTCRTVLAQEQIAETFCFPTSPNYTQSDSNHSICDVNPLDPVDPEVFYRNSNTFLEWHDGFQKYHLGEDWNGSQGYSGDLGSPVYSIAVGRVVYRVDTADPPGQPDDWGKVMVIRHELYSGEIVYALYAHLEEFLVPDFCHLASSPACIVDKGQQIATIGDGNGYYSNPVNCNPNPACAHLHFELRKVFAYWDENIIPGDGYIASDTDPFIDIHYYHPTDFITLHRAYQCVPLSGERGSSCGSQPIISTEDVSLAGQESASLPLTINPNGDASEFWFEWSLYSSESWTVTDRGSVSSGTSQIPASLTISGLTCGTQYEFRAMAENIYGLATPGSILQFSTASCDGGGGGPQTLDLINNGDFHNDENHWTVAGDFHANDDFDNYNFSRGYAYLSESNGDPGNDLVGWIYQEVTIPSNADEATLEYWISISTSEPNGGPGQDFLNITLQDGSGGYLATLDFFSNQDADSGYQRSSFDLINFAGETIRINFLGTTNNDSQPTVFRIDDVSLDVELSGGGPPAVTTRSPDQITSSSARLQMTVNANGLNTDVWFDFEANDSTPNDDTPHVFVGNSTDDQYFSYSVFGLECDTRYYVEANASNDAGSDDGSTRYFDTDTCPATPPRVDTDPATEISRTGARLNGDVNPNGLSTDVWLEWGDSPSLGNATSRIGVGSGTSWESFSDTLSGLDCETTYYFEAHAENAAGEDDEVTLSFTTGSCDIPPPNIGEFIAWASEQACDGSSPAVLLLWSEPVGATGSYTVRQVDGPYTATVDATTEGRQHLINSGLELNQRYDFVVEADTSDGTVVSDTVPVYVVNHKCLAASLPDQVPGPVLLWNEPPFCQGGNPAVQLRWTESPGVSTYDLQRISSGPGEFYTIEDLTTESYLETNSFVPGNRNIFRLTRHNAQGSLTAPSSRWLHLFMPSTVCNDPGFPGPFSLSLGDPVCDEGEPAVQINWSASQGADDFYGVHALGEDRSQRGSTVNAPAVGFTKTFSSLTAGTSYEIFATASDPNDETIVRYSNSIFIRVPLDICGSPSAPPVVQTQVPAAVTPEVAVLTSTVKTEGSPTEVHFEWGETMGYGSTTTPVSIGTRVLTQRPGAVVDGLACQTEYHYRVVASSTQGTTFGDDVSFTTGQCPANTAPEAFGDAYVTAQETLLQVAAPGVLDNDSDAEGDELATELVGSVQNGTLNLELDGSFEYTPDVGFTGDDTFTYRAFDGGSYSTVVTVTISVNPLQAPAVALVEPDGIADTADSSYLITWLDEDSDSDAAISLWYSQDVSCASPSLIASGISENDEADQYQWDPSGLPDGQYMVLIAIDDGQMTDSHCAGPVLVSHSNDCNGASCDNLIFLDGFENGGLTSWVVVSDPVSPTVIFEDDFDDDALDTVRWPVAIRHTVREQNQRMEVTADETDQYGLLDSAWFEIDATRPVIVERRVFQHRGNTKYNGSLELQSETQPAYRLRVYYSDIDYSDGTFCPAQGFFLGTGNPHVCADVTNNLVSTPTAGVWDQWFDEKLEFDPQTGAVTYSIDGVARITWTIPSLPASPSGPDRLRLRVSPAGWWTGHQHFFDDLIVKQ